MPTKTFTSVRSEEHVISEANGRLSREQVDLDTVAADLNAGTVLGKVTASGKYVQLDPAAVDGSEAAAAVLAPNVTAPDTPADVRTVVHARDCEVNGNKIFWPAGITGPEQVTAEAELATLGIIVRY